MTHVHSREGAGTLNANPLTEYGLPRGGVLGINSFGGSYMLPNIIPNRLRALTPWKEGDVISDFQRSMNRMMRDFFDETPSFNLQTPDWALTGGEFVPRIDLEEGDDKITLTAELPGMTEKDVDVQLERDFLTVKGEKKQEKSVEKNGRTFCERSYGAFERTIQMPTSVDKDKIVAKFDNGVLTVSIPKSPEAKREVKKIAIKH